MGKSIEHLGNVDDVTAMTEILTDLRQNGYELTSTSDNITLSTLEIAIITDEGKDIIQNGSKIILQQGTMTEKTIRVSWNAGTEKHYVKISNKWYEISVTNGEFHMAEDGVEEILGYNVILTTPRPNTEGEQCPKIMIKGEEKEVGSAIVLSNGTTLDIIAGQTIGIYSFGISIENMSYSHDVPIEIVANPKYATALSLSATDDITTILRGNTLQLLATKTPQDSTDTITWRIIDGSENGSVDERTGLVTINENATAGSTITIGANCVRADKTDTTVQEQTITLNITANFTISYHGNGATNNVTMQSKEVQYGESITLQENIFEKSGYDFMGWNSRADGNGIDYSDKQNITNIENDIELYAVWRDFLETVTILDENINKDKYGYKVQGYNVTTDEFTSGIWRLYLQNAKFTYIITDTCVGSYIPYDYCKNNSKYTSGASVGIVGNKLNPSFSGHFTDTNKEINICVTAWMDDKDEWSAYANEDALFAIASPTAEMFSKSYGTLSLHTGFSSNGYSLSTKNSEAFSTERHGIYCKNIGDIYWLASPSSNGWNKVLMIKTGENSAKHMDSTTQSYSVRPVVCFKTSVFNEKYTLVDE